MVARRAFVSIQFSLKMFQITLFENQCFKYFEKNILEIFLRKIWRE